ncbi:hypothetical protein LCGC14_1122720 [marine sediment metagenome]|uniref:Uncharacterized protein n=1 Tax=marine sediment metagenome TaxID=412755 RepID=A0A0F9MRB8_9ZZZZ
MEKILVRVIMHKNNAYLVQYVTDENIINRVIVPMSDLEMKDNKQGYVTEEALEMGIPHGIPWEIHLNDLNISSEEFAIALHKAGIWTYEDAINDPQGRTNALRSTLTPVLREVKTILKKYR